MLPGFLAGGDFYSPNSQRIPSSKCLLSPRGESAATRAPCAANRSDKEIVPSHSITFHLIIMDSVSIPLLPSSTWHTSPGRLTFSELSESNFNDIFFSFLDILRSGMASRWRLNDGLAGHWIKQWLGVAAIKGALQASTRWLLLHFGAGAVQQLGGWPARLPH
jgi:hypothetical protein